MSKMMKYTSDGVMKKSFVYFKEISVTNNIWKGNRGVVPNAFICV